MQITLYVAYDNKNVQDTIQTFAKAEDAEQMSVEFDWDEYVLCEHEVHLGNEPAEYAHNLCEYLNDVLITEILELV